MRSAAIGFGLVGFLGGEAAGKASADHVGAEPVLLVGEGADAVEGFLADADGDLGSRHDASVSHRVALWDSMGYGKGMTTTQSNAAGNITIVTRDGERIGRVIGTDKFGGRVQARRVRGEQGVDIRRISQGFKTITAAVAWIEKAS